MKKLITMLSAFTITTSTAALAVACSSEIKGQSINIDEITADMIINYKNEYTVKNDTGEDVKVAANQLGTLSKGKLEGILKNNSYGIILTKITGLEDSKINGELGELNDSEWKNFMIARAFVLNDMDFYREDKKDAEVKPEEETKVDPVFLRVEALDDKNFKITIDVKKWDTVKDMLQKKIEVSFKSNCWWS